MTTLEKKTKELIGKNVGTVTLNTYEGEEPICPKCNHKNAMLLEDSVVESNGTGRLGKIVERLCCRDCGYEVISSDIKRNTIANHG